MVILLLFRCKLTKCCTKCHEENTSHLFIYCLYSQQVWNGVESMLGKYSLGCLGYLSDCFLVWFQQKELKQCITMVKLLIQV